MEINTLDVSAARGGAAFTGACSPWTILQAPGLPAAGMNHVLAPNPAAVLPSAAGTRKPYLSTTRVNAAGDGASGPHPEREPA